MEYVVLRIAKQNLLGFDNMHINNAKRETFLTHGPKRRTKGNGPPGPKVKWPQLI